MRKAYVFAVGVLLIVSASPRLSIAAERPATERQLPRVAPKTLTCPSTVRITTSIYQGPPGWTGEVLSGFEMYFHEAVIFQGNRFTCIYNHGGREIDLASIHQEISGGNCVIQGPTVTCH